MRLGGPVFKKYADPGEWVAALCDLGYRAAYCPVTTEAPDSEVEAYRHAAKKADMVIAEVGAWSNPMSNDSDEAKKALDLCIRSLDLAERIGARCCVNIAGSLSSKWDGPHPLNYAADTFDRIVELTRKIIDAINPKRTFYTIETMPWMIPDSTESYEKLLLAVDRPGFAVHFDPANLICSPRLFYGNGLMIQEFVRRLGGHIRSCHAKDIRLADHMTTHLDEVAPGDGGLDYRTFLHEIARLDPDTPVMLEHLSTAAEYQVAADYVRAIAVEENISL